MDDIDVHQCSPDGAHPQLNERGMCCKRLSLHRACLPCAHLCFYAWHLFCGTSRNTLDKHSLLLQTMVNWVTNYSVSASLYISTSIIVRQAVDARTPSPGVCPLYTQVALVHAMLSGLSDNERVELYFCGIAWLHAPMIEHGSQGLARWEKLSGDHGVLQAEACTI
eukprot:scaffold168091_cov18-Tisochrysis_lutea.AAC.2